MKIAITGSSGLIGRALVGHLNSLGHEVVHLVRSQQEAVDATHCWWEPEQGVKQLDKLEDVSILVHLAGRNIAQRRWTAAEKELIYRSRVEATERLCASLKQLAEPLKLFVAASAVGVYGDRADQLVTEDVSEASHQSAETATAAGGVRYLVELGQKWEAAAQSLTAVGTPVVHPRFGVVLSPEGGALAKMLPLFRWGLGSSLGNGQQYWSWIALEDVVRAIAWIIERHAQYAGVSVYNFVSPNPVTNAEFTRVLAARLKRFRFLPVPKFALRLGLGEMADAALLASCRAVPARLVHEGYHFKWPELAATLESFEI